MATYKYQAFDKAEKKVSGIISASDTIEARNLLISRELNPLKIVPGKENKSKTKISQKFKHFQKFARPLAHGVW